MCLTASETFAPVVEKILRELRDKIATLVPDQEVHHIGATAIPGALTKGDLDVLLRVERTQFLEVLGQLRTGFAVRQPENWDPHFASFGTEMFELPVGVQVVVRDSEADFFLHVRDYLRTHPASLAEYNRAKTDNSQNGPAAYWAAKDRVLRPLIALRAHSTAPVPEPIPRDGHSSSPE